MQTGEVAYFLIWLVLVIFMSGWGCGAHAVRRRLAAAPLPAPAPAGRATDPVCGRMVAMPSARFAIHRSVAYHFCSETCRHAFEIEPARFLARRAHPHVHFT